MILLLSVLQAARVSSESRMNVIFLIMIEKIKRMPDGGILFIVGLKND